MSISTVNAPDGAEGTEDGQPKQGEQYGAIRRLARADKQR
jgi:hypothetical protein